MNFTVTNLVVLGYQAGLVVIFLMQLFLSCDWSISHLRSGRFTAHNIV